MRRRIFFITLLLVLPGYRLGAFAQELPRRMGDSQTNCAPSDWICGPRSVRYLLSFYGHDEDLYALVKEIQWPDVSQGASLDSLARSLRKRGVYTSGVLLSDKAGLTWDYPSLVHFRATGESGLGHFAVWMPSSDCTQTRLWSGLAGYEVMPTLEFNRVRSGEVLLTSPHPIPDGYSCAVTNWRFWLGGCLLFAIAGATVAIATFLFVRFATGGRFLKGGKP